VLAAVSVELDVSRSVASQLTCYERPFTLVDQLVVSCLWLAYNVQWGALLFIVLPNQIAAIVGEQHKEAWLGTILPVGAAMSMLITPIAGALSDRCRARWGKRRPFLLVGGLINIGFLLACAPFGAGSNVWGFMAMFVGLQFGCNWWGGPYAGLIPDIVPKEKAGQASGFQALNTALGTILGAVLGGMLSRSGSYHNVYFAVAGILGLFLVITLLGVRERPNHAPATPFEIGEFVRSFAINPREHPNFYWVLITRAMICMGVYSISVFFQYFLKDVVKAGDPVAATQNLMVIIIGMGIPTSIVAGQLSDRHGRKPLVYASGAVMAIAVAIFVPISFFPTVAAAFVVGGLFGIGNGAYQAVDWALAIDVLPNGDDAAKDMGVWHVALVLPQILAPSISGLVLNTLKARATLEIGYTAVFAMATLWFILGTVFVRKVRGVR
jgi:Na+/melibiose symporter-like transporter